MFDMSISRADELRASCKQAVLVVQASCSSIKADVVELPCSIPGNQPKWGGLAILTFSHPFPFWIGGERVLHFVVPMTWMQQEISRYLETATQ